MKKTVCIMLLAVAVISCKDTLKKAQENINADSASATKKATTEKETPKPAKTEEQIAQEASKLWMEKIAAAEWQNAYHRSKEQGRYMKFDTPVLKDGVITGEYQLKWKWYGGEEIYFYRYSMPSYSKIESEVIKITQNGVEKEDAFAGHKGTEFVKFFDGGNTLLITDADPDSDTRNRSVSTYICKH